MPTIHLHRTVMPATTRLVPSVTIDGVSSMADVPDPPSLGPWVPVEAGVHFKVKVRVFGHPSPPVTPVPCSVAVDLSDDGGATWTTTTPVPAGLADMTGYAIPVEIAPADGSSFRLRIGGNVGVRVSVDRVEASGTVIT